MSTKLALETILQARCYHFDELLWRPDHVDAWLARIHDNVHIDFHWLFKDYSATLDFPFCLYFEEMLAAFPDAKVVLTYRDPEKWYASIHSMLALLRIVDILVAPLPYGRKIMAVARFHLYGNAAGAFGAYVAKECHQSLRGARLPRHRKCAGRSPPRL